MYREEGTAPIFRINRDGNDVEVPTTIPYPLQQPDIPLMSRNQARHQRKQLKKVKKKVNGLKFKEALAKRGYLGPEHIIAKPSEGDRSLLEQVQAAFDTPE